MRADLWIDFKDCLLRGGRCEDEGRERGEEEEGEGGAGERAHLLGRVLGEDEGVEQGEKTESKESRVWMLVLKRDRFR